MRAIAATLFTYQVIDLRIVFPVIPDARVSDAFLPIVYSHYVCQILALLCNFGFEPFHNCSFRILQIRFKAMAFLNDSTRTVSFPRVP